MDSRYLKLGVAAVSAGVAVLVVLKRKEEMDKRKQVRRAVKQSITPNQVGEKQ